MKQFPLILLACNHKGLVEYNGKPWILRQLRHFGEVHGHRAVVVLGPHYNEYFEAIPWLKNAKSKPVDFEGVAVSVDIDAHEGASQFSRLQHGARFISVEKFNGAFVLPVEVAATDASVWTHLKHAMIGDVHAAVPVWNEKLGYPALLSHRYLETLLDMPAESKLETQIAVLEQDHLKRVEVEDASVCMTISEWREHEQA